MKREEDQELWDLLAKGSQPPAVSPFFARNVVRQIRQEPSRGVSIFRWFRPRPLIAAGAIAAALVITTVYFRPAVNDPRSSDNVPATVAVIEPQDYEVVADLDDLLASDDDGVWDETDSLSL